MKSWVIGVGFAYVIGYLSRVIVGYWKNHRDGIKESLLSVDERIESGWHVDLPDKWQEAYHKIISDAVAYVDKYASDGAFWRNLMRRIRRMKPSQATEFLNFLRNIDWSVVGKDVGKWLLENLPSGLKSIVNEEKHEIAAGIVRAKVVAAMPAERQKIDQSDLNSRIAAAATAGKVVERVSPIRKPEVQALIEELRKKVDSQS